VYCEANACADALANMGLDMDDNFMVYDVCPEQVKLYFLADISGVLSPWLVMF
jgi:hypothetical protein